MRRIIFLLILFLMFGCLSQSPELTPLAKENSVEPVKEIETRAEPSLNASQSESSPLPEIEEEAGEPKEAEEELPSFVPEEPQFEEVIPGVGKGTTFGREEDGGPWKHRINRAHSKDGLVWVRDPEVLAEQASVPDALLDAEGNLRVYYVDWKNQGVTVAIEKENAWKYYRVLVKPKNFFEGADPDVVLVNGTYYLFFTHFISQSSREASIDRAVSPNGVEFTDQRVVYPLGAGITDADIFLTSKGWSMFISNGPQNVLATSTDGNSFTKKNKLPFQGSVSNTIPVSGGYRMYYHKNREKMLTVDIYSAFSADGITWEEEGLRLKATSDEESVESPTVVVLNDGSYVMFYHSMIK